ncbi:hypothetical protein T12_15138, partial [Trichinella patagoniensis]
MYAFDFCSMLMTNFEFNFSLVMIHYFNLKFSTSFIMQILIANVSCAVDVKLNSRFLETVLSEVAEESVSSKFCVILNNKLIQIWCKNMSMVKINRHVSHPEL